MRALQSLLAIPILALHALPKPLLAADREVAHASTLTVALRFAFYRDANTKPMSHYRLDYGPNSPIKISPDQGIVNIIERESRVRITIGYREKKEELTLRTPTFLATPFWSDPEIGPAKPGSGKWDEPVNPSDLHQQQKKDIDLIRKHLPIIGKAELKVEDEDQVLRAALRLADQELTEVRLAVDRNRPTPKFDPSDRFKSQSINPLKENEKLLLDYLDAALRKEDLGLPGGQKMAGKVRKSRNWKSAINAILSYYNQDMYGEQNLIDDILGKAIRAIGNTGPCFIAAADDEGWGGVDNEAPTLKLGVYDPLEKFNYKFAESQGDEVSSEIHGPIVIFEGLDFQSAQVDWLSEAKRLLDGLNVSFGGRLGNTTEVDRFLDKYFRVRGHYVADNEKPSPYNEIGWACKSEWLGFRASERAFVIRIKAPRPLGQVEFYLEERCQPSAQGSNCVTVGEWKKIRGVLLTLVPSDAWDSLAECATTIQYPDLMPAPRCAEACKAVKVSCHLEGKVFVTVTLPPFPLYYRRFSRVEQAWPEILSNENQGMIAEGSVEERILARGFVLGDISPVYGSEPGILRLQLHEVSQKAEKDPKIATNGTQGQGSGGGNHPADLALWNRAHQKFEIGVANYAGQGTKSSLTYTAYGAVSLHAEAGYFGEPYGKLGLSSRAWLPIFEQPAWLSVEGYSLTDPDRQFGTASNADETRVGVRGDIGWDIGRNYRGLDVIGSFQLFSEGVKLSETEDSGRAIADAGLWGASLGARFVQEAPGIESLLPFGDWRSGEIRLRTGGGLGDALYWGIDARWARHSLWGNFLECDWRLFAGYANASTPIQNLPRLGGEDTVRGFREDHTQGNFVWSMQSELWYPLSSLADTGLPILKHLNDWYLATSLDFGGAFDPPLKNQGFLMGSALGLRYREGTRIIRGDWSYGLLDDFTGRHGNFATFSITQEF